MSSQVDFGREEREASLISASQILALCDTEEGLALAHLFAFIFSIQALRVVRLRGSSSSPSFLRGK